MNGRDVGQALRLPLSHREFDLAEVMDAAGDQSHLRWVLRGAWLNGDLATLWPEGVERAERDTERPGGASLTWAQMSSLARSRHQVIDGRFTGYDVAGRPVLELHAIDSSYWVVWARDGEVLARFRTAFSDAETYDEPTPEPLRHLPVMAWVIPLLAMAGGLVLSATFFVDVDSRLVAAAWLAWLTALTLGVVLAVRFARRKGQSRRSAVRAGARESWAFVKAFMP